MERQELERIFSSEASAFYRNFWERAPASLTDVRSLPLSNLAETDLYSRLYRDEPGLVKTVDTGAGAPFLVKRAWSDISADRLPIEAGSRVFVLMENTEEGLERALSVYEHDSVPYLGDLNNLEASLVSAEQFRLTLLICDQAVCRRLIEANLIPVAVTKILVIDKEFDGKLDQAGGSRKIEFFLTLPEAGVLGQVTKDHVLRPISGVHLEAIDHKCVLTKPHLITPLIRYETSLTCEPDGTQLRLIRHSSS